MRAGSELFFMAYLEEANKISLSLFLTSQHLERACVRECEPEVHHGGSRHVTHSWQVKHQRRELGFLASYKFSVSELVSQ